MRRRAANEVAAAGHRSGTLSCPVAMNAAPTLGSSGVGAARRRPGREDPGAPSPEAFRTRLNASGARSAISW